MDNDVEEEITLGIRVLLEKEIVDEINNARFYLVVVDSGFFDNPLSIGEFLYAKSINKPIGIALKMGIVLPMEFVSGARVFAVEYWDDNENSINECADRLVEMYARYIETESNDT